MQEKIWSKRAKQEVSRSNGFKNLYGLIFDPRKERKTWHSWGERKKLGYMNLYKRKQGTSQKGFFLAHNRFTFWHKWITFWKERGVANSETRRRANNACTKENSISNWRNFHDQCCVISFIYIAYPFICLVNL